MALCPGRGCADGVDVVVVGQRDGDQAVHPVVAGDGSTTAWAETRWSAAAAYSDVTSVWFSSLAIAVIASYIIRRLGDSPCLRIARGIESLPASIAYSRRSVLKY
jgi:hypothetical protein